MNTDLNSHPIVAELWRRLYQWADEAERARTAR